MSITVSQAMTFGGLARGRLLAGERNLGNVIDGVDVIEIPFTPDLEWDSSGYLLITSFYAIREDLNSQIATIELLAQWKCAALVIQLTILSELPEPVIRRAEELGLPLIEIPEAVPYSDVITPLVGAILEEKSYLLQRSEEIHRRLTDLCLSGGGLPAIADALSDLVHCPVAIADAWGCLVCVAHWDTPDERVLDWLRKGAQSFVFKTPKVVYDPEQGTWVMQLFSGEQHRSDGYILVSDPSRALSTIDLLAVEQASIIAALEMVKQRTILETERRLQRDFFEYILGEQSQRNASDDEIISRAHALGWELRDKPVVALIDISWLLTHPRFSAGQGPDAWGVKDHIVDIYTDAVKTQDAQAILVDQGEQLLLLLHCEKGIPDAALRRELQARLEAICAGLKSRLDDFEIGVTLGGFYPRVGELKKSYDEARLALRVSRRLALPQTIVWYDDVALYVLLERIASQPEITGWFERTLGKLSEYDRVNRTDLVRTLEVYFDANQMLQQAAFSLFVHPKTLKYRLHRIEEILGSDPFSQDQQLKYYLATKLARLFDFSPRG